MLDDSDPIVTWRRGDWVCATASRRLCLLGAPSSFSVPAPLTRTPSVPRPNQSFALAPVLVCKEPTKTVGLGDSISAAGLASAVWLRRPSA